MRLRTSPLSGFDNHLNAIRHVQHVLPESRETFRIPLRGRMVFDCRFYGAFQIAVESRYRHFLRLIEAAAPSPEAPEWTTLYQDFNMLPLDDYHDAYCQSASSDQDKRRQAQAQLHRMLLRARTEIGIHLAASWNNPDFVIHRRVGLGDQIVLIDILQKISRLLGPDNLVVVVDKTYPQSDTLFGSSGLTVVAASHTERLSHVVRDLPGSGWSACPLRAHPMDNGVAGDHAPAYGEYMGYPGYQILFDMGWLDVIRALPIEIYLSPSVSAERQAERYLRSVVTRSGHRPWRRSPGTFMTINPVEETRRNTILTVDCWVQILKTHGAQGHIVLAGCCPHEVPFVNRLRDSCAPHDITIEPVQTNLMSWVSMLRRSAMHFSGNTAGMWLGFAVRTPLVIASCVSDCHGVLWEPKPTWFPSDRLSNITIESVTCEDWNVPRA